MLGTGAAREPGAAGSQEGRATQRAADGAELRRETEHTHDGGGHIRRSGQVVGPAGRSLTERHELARPAGDEHSQGVRTEAMPLDLGSRFEAPSACPAVRKVTTAMEK